MRPRRHTTVISPLTDTLARGQVWGYRMIFASMRVVRSFLRAPAVIKFVLRAASTFRWQDIMYLLTRQENPFSLSILPNGEYH